MCYQANGEAKEVLRESWEEGESKDEDTDDSEVLGLSEVVAGRRHVKMVMELLDFIAGKISSAVILRHSYGEA